MITEVEYEQYNSSYYKTDIRTESFLKYINEYFCDRTKYDCKTTVHADGLFFERKRKSSFAVLNANIEIIFSQRKNYSLIAILYYIPVITKYYRYILLLLLITVTVVAQIFSFSSNALRLFNLAVAAIVLFKDIINLAIHKLAAIDINIFLDRVLNSPQKIKLQQYHSLLNEDEV